MGLHRFEQLTGRVFAHDHGRLRDELLNGWRFDSLLEAEVLIEDWRIDYNNNRPHTAHGNLTQPSSPKPGPTNTNQHSHNHWTSQRGPLIVTRLLLTVDTNLLDNHHLPRLERCLMLPHDLIAAKIAAIPPNTAPRSR
jgi:Integrase core domain